MIKLTIKTRDYPIFTISGLASDIMTAVAIFKAGLQVKQDIEITVTQGVNPAYYAMLPDIKLLDQIVAAYISAEGN
jgi:hypothetical protein